jgi:hypothetical protein
MHSYSERFTADRFVIKSGPASQLALSPPKVANETKTIFKLADETRRILKFDPSRM